MTPMCYALLATVHPHLASVIAAASSDPACPLFRVVSALRTEIEHRRMIMRGVTKQWPSPHVTGHAVDLMPVDRLGDRINDRQAWIHLSGHVVKRAALDGVSIDAHPEIAALPLDLIKLDKWGHFELSRDVYDWSPNWSSAASTSMCVSAADAAATGPEYGKPTSQGGSDKTG